MKTVLDLVGEFASINDEKLRCGGKLPPDWERRWSELKGFYDLLMVQNGTPRRPLSRSFSADDIRVRVKDRQRLRVLSELDVVLKCEEGYYAGQIVNLSCSGVFLTSQMVLHANSELVLFLSNRGFLEAEGEVMWMNEGSPGNELSRGMGLCFERDSGPGSLRYQLDCIVIDTLEKQLSGVDSSAIAPMFSSGSVWFCKERVPQSPG